MSTRPLDSQEPTSPLTPDFPADDSASRTDQDDGVQKVAQSRFPKFSAGLASLKNWVQRKISINNGYLLSIFLAAYPIAKFFLLLIAGAASTFPPVAAILLITAATLFLITVCVDLKKNRKRDPQFVKSAITTCIAFVFAPITSAGIVCRALYTGAKALMGRVHMHSRTSTQARGH